MNIQLKLVTLFHRYLPSVDRLQCLGYKQLLNFMLLTF